MDEKPEPTEAEQIAAGRKMLSAALATFKKFPDTPEDEGRDDIARRVVHALVAAGSVQSAERKRWREAGKADYNITEARDAVATAFWMWSERIEMDVSEVSPESVAGGRLLAFAQGLAAATAMTEALDLMDEGSMFAFSSRGAVHLAQKYPQEP